MKERFLVSKLIKEVNKRIIETNQVRSWFRNEDDWLKEDHPDKWNKRMNYYKDKKLVLEKLVKWLSDLDQETISSKKVKSKLTEIEKNSRRRTIIEGSLKRI